MMYDILYNNSSYFMIISGDINQFGSSQYQNWFKGHFMVETPILLNDGFKVGETTNKFFRWCVSLFDGG